MCHNLKNRKLAFIFIQTTVYIIFFACDGKGQERNRIIFQDSVYAVEDSIVIMNRFMDRLIKREVNNIFFDRNDFVYINNKKIGRMIGGDKVDYLNTVQEETGFSKSESLRFLSLALFLKDNHLGGCYKHKVFEVYFYVYRMTSPNDYEDTRNILLMDKTLRDVKGSPIESFQVLDRKGQLILVAPSDVKVN